MDLGSYKKWFVGNDIRDLLVSNSGITSMVGQNIYPLLAPEPKQGQKNIGNYIVYCREKYSKSFVKQGVYDDECLLSISIVCDNYDEGCRIAEMVDDILSGKHMTDNNRLIEINLYDSTEAFTDDKFIETLVYKIK